MTDFVKNNSVLVIISQKNLLISKNRLNLFIVRNYESSVCFILFYEAAN